MFTRDDIQKEYERLGHEKGWTFMACPEARLRTAEVVLVGMNPGGGSERDQYKYGGTWDVPEGNAYYVEKWAAGGGETAIQGQIKQWHRLLGLGEDETLCPHFVPFRSPGWADLPRKAEAVEFGRRLWNGVLKASPASLFITMGKEPGRQLAALLQAQHWATLPTGWGRQTIEVYDSPDGRRIVAMPHPSRFTLFGRGEASATAEQSFKAAIDRT